MVSFSIFSETISKTTPIWIYPLSPLLSLKMIIRHLKNNQIKWKNHNQKENVNRINKQTEEKDWKKKEEAYVMITEQGFALRA